MYKVLAFAGQKTSGKNTMCNFLTGYQLRANNIVKNFDLTEDGKLYIESENGSGVLDLDAHHTNSDFYNWISNVVWPFCKIYAFAEPLKEICIGLFNIPRECLYGSNDDKNKIIPHLLWENMPGVISEDILKESCLHSKYEWGIKELTDDVSDLNIVIHKSGPMTAREFMQFFGTEVMRKIWEPVWCKAITDLINAECSILSLVSDLRFSNEVASLKSLPQNQFDVKVVKLTKGISKDKHVSETDFNNIEEDFLLDNANMTIIQTCEELMNKLNQWGWINGN